MSVTTAGYQSRLMDGKWKDFAGDQGDHGKCTARRKINWKNVKTAVKDKQQ